MVTARRSREHEINSKDVAIYLREAHHDEGCECGFTSALAPSLFSTFN